MRIKLLYISQLIGLLWLLCGCSQDREEPENSSQRGISAFVEVSIEDYIVGNSSRATVESYDKRTIVNFTSEDKVGMFALQGIAKPENESDFSFPANNVKMNFEGRSGNYFRFGNSEVLMDPTTINEALSILYYPYIENMPDVKDPEQKMGVRLREMNDGIEKCIDFLHTSGNHITVTDGVLKPSFSHEFFSLAIQRGNGFKNPLDEDDRIWVVMNNPYTDISIKLRKRAANTTDSIFYFDLQYHPEDDNVMVDILGDSRFIVNKHALWQTWEGREMNGIHTNYAILPPDNVYFILIKDDYGNWHNVTDFSLGSGKKGNSGTRYILTIELQETGVVAKPVSVENWDDEISISDNRKVGINGYDDYYQWVIAYNTYIGNNRKTNSETELKELLKYGDAKRIEGTDEIEWTFYINNDFEFRNSDSYQITRLEDVLEGSSTYVNYTLSNLRTTMIGEIGEKGCLRALDFKDLYIINPETKTTPSGAITDKLTGGSISNCNIFNGVMIGWGETGMVAGEANGGKISQCVFSGDVIGTSSASNFNGMFGIIGELGAPEVDSETHSSGLKFIEN